MLSQKKINCKPHAISVHIARQIGDPFLNFTRSSAIAKGPHDASCH